MSANTVTWRGLIPALVATAAKAPKKEARDFAMSQLLLLGEIVDRHIANLSVLEQSLPAQTEETTGIIPAPPEGVTMVGFDDPRKLHNAIADAVGEPLVREEGDVDDGGNT